MEIPASFQDPIPSPVFLLRHKPWSRKPGLLMPEAKFESLLYARGLVQNGIAVSPGLAPPEFPVTCHPTSLPPHPSPSSPQPSLLLRILTPASLGITWHQNMLHVYTKRSSCQKRSTLGPFFFVTQNLAVASSRKPALIPQTRFHHP